ncbi:MAG TPA: sulfite exporter TauE/SafE family protein [Candidatus Acidoferrum sp.]|nr:sulfite exporter TauE/SafE family protein [Candidatus Acidoferrum sp.]
MTLLIGIIIGAVLGLTGAGGSVLAVPLLAVFLKLPAAEATGISLGVVAASSAWGAIDRIIHKQVLWIPAALFGISGMVFAPIGRWLTVLVDPLTLKIAFIALSLLIAARMLWQSFRQPEQARLVRGDTGNDEAETDPLLCRLSETRRFDWRPRCMVGLFAGGVLTGLLSGFFGVGGGFLIVPFLTQLNSVSMRQAIATSLVIIAGVSSSGFAMQLLTQQMNLSLLLWLAAGGVAGMIAGSLLAKHIAGVVLQRLFALTIIAMTLLLLTTRG